MADDENLAAEFSDGRSFAYERCFDPALAEFPTRMLRADEVIDLLHVSHVPERVEQYRQAMQQGHRFPPISVVRIVGRFFVADGHKRFSAYLSLGAGEVLVEVWTTRRWLQDQWHQLRSKTRTQWILLGRSVVDPRAREQGVRLFWDSIGHWRRIVASTIRRRQFPGRSRRS